MPGVLQSHDKEDVLGHVLAVEDDPVTLLMLENMLKGLGYKVLCAEGGREAVEIVNREAENLDAIVLDRKMPDVDGLRVVDEISQSPRSKHIPVVMLTGLDAPEEIREGINAGVFYYLTKPFNEDVLGSILNSAVQEIQRKRLLQSEMRKHRTSFSLLDRAEFSLRTLEEAEDLSCFLANCFPDPDQALPGLAALMVNAVEHGNLNIGYERKTKLIEEGRWREFIEQRQSAPEHMRKRVYVYYMREAEGVSVKIVDEGGGFNWRQYLEVDPARAMESHGRGIAQASVISFDRIEFNEKGNEVTVYSSFNSVIEW